MSESAPLSSRQSSREVLPWLSVLRLLCALEIVGFHWLRANFRLGLFGCAGALNVVADYQDTRLGLHGFAPVLSQACKPRSVALMDEVLGVLFGYGWEAVNIFIVISGFTLALGLPRLRPQSFWKHWYSRRLKRILLPYYAVALPFITAFIILLRVPATSSGLLARFQLKLSTLFSGGVLSTYLTHIFLLDPTKRQWIVAFFSPAWWFVPAILIAYLFFPLFAIAAEKLGTKSFLLLALLVSLSSYALTAAGFLVENAWYFVVLNECFSLSIGIVAGAIWRDPARRASLLLALSAPWVIPVGFLLVIVGNMANWFRMGYAFSSPLFTVGLCMLGYRLSVQLARSQHVRHFASIDAYMLYLLHQPLATPFTILSVAIFHAQTAILGLPFYVAVCCALAWVVQRFVFSRANNRARLSPDAAAPVRPPDAYTADLSSGSNLT